MGISKKANNNRRYPGEHCRCRPDQAAARRTEAKERQDKYDNLTPQQRLDLLDIKFGVGNGATKQRAKLLFAIKNGQNNKKVSNNTENAVVQSEIPAEIMAEIDAMNEDGSGKRKMKAKDRRLKKQKSDK